MKLRRGRGRIYLRSRRAYFPRLWPLLLVAVLVSGAVAFIHMAWWGHVLSGLAIGAAIAFGRIEAWKRKHPMLSMQEMVQDHLDDLRRKAPYN